MVTVFIPGFYGLQATVFMTDLTDRDLHVLSFGSIFYRCPPFVGLNSFALLKPAQLAVPQGTVMHDTCPS
jgi:hypothetical protein